MGFKKEMTSPKAYAKLNPKILGYYGGKHGHRTMNMIKQFLKQKTNEYTTTQGKPLYQDLIAKYFDKELSSKLHNERIVDDIRWNDNRLMWWKCPNCDASQRTVAAAFFAEDSKRCRNCRHDTAAPFIGRKTTFTTKMLKDFPEAYAQCLEKAEFKATFSADSGYEAKWQCQNCPRYYLMTIRARVGTWTSYDWSNRTREASGSLEVCAKCQNDYGKVREYREKCCTRNPETGNLRSYNPLRLEL